MWKIDWFFPIIMIKGSTIGWFSKLHQIKVVSLTDEFPTSSAYMTIKFRYIIVMEICIIGCNPGLCLISRSKVNGRLFRPMLVCSHVIYCKVRQSGETELDLFYSPQSASDKWCSLDAMIRIPDFKVKHGMTVCEFGNKWCANYSMIVLETKSIISNGHCCDSYLKQAKAACAKWWEKRFQVFLKSLQLYKLKVCMILLCPYLSILNI
jgi:hypothetical protein